MPTYDYQCRSCGTVTEVIHAMLDSGPSVCEHCGGELRRVLYPAGIIFKGSGFYRTDSRASGAAADGKASTASGDAKPASADTSASSDATSSAPAKPESGAGKTSTPGAGDAGGSSS